MDSKKNIFKKYRARLMREAVLKSILAGAAIGCGVAAITELCSWFFGFKAGFILAIVLLVAVTAVAAFIFYYIKFRPTMKAVAHRIDELGLEERVLTMTELDGQTSYIAQAQRDDTMNALGKVNHTLLKLAITAAMVVTICVTGGLWLGMTTVNALYFTDVIPSGMELVKGEPQVPSYTVKYKVQAGTGCMIYIYDEDWTEPEPVPNIFYVYEGEDAPAVLAVAADGYVFTGWGDGNTDPYRHDLAVKGNIEVTAKFEAVRDKEEEDSRPSGDGLLTSDEYNKNQQKNEQQMPPPPPSSNEPKDNPGMESDPSRQLYNGQTYYGSDWGSKQQDGQNDLKGNGEISDSTKDGIGDYYDTLNPGDSGDSSEGEGDGN